MSLIDKLISIVVPHECIGCGAEGTLLCTGCLQRQQPAPARCYRCLKASPKGAICVSCGPALLHSAQSALAYQGLAKDLLWGLKSGGMQAAAQPMAAALAVLVSEGTVIVPVPTASRRVRMRGYDQSILIARQLSRKTGLPCRQLLRRTGQTHQVGATRELRTQQLVGAYHAKPATGLHIVLVDDVMTTGATLEAAASALLDAGALRVDAITFARA